MPAKLSSKQETNILFVEDEQPFFYLVDRMLAVEGENPFRVHWARDLAEASRMLEEMPLDLVLLDLFLPDSGGLETIHRVREMAPSLPILVMTGTGDEDLASEVLRQGAQDFLEKSDIRPNLLRRSIRYAMERKEAEEGLKRIQQNLAALVGERTRELEEANQLLLQEIGERREAEEALRRSEEQSRLILRNNPIATVVYDLEGRVVYANPRFEEKFGWPLGELTGRRLDFVPPEARDETQTNLAVLNRGDRVPGFETTRLTKDGSRLEVLITAVPLVGQDGSRLGNVVTFRDITELRRSEEAKRESERRYQRLVETISEGLIEVDVELRPVFFNQRLTEMLGYSAEELQEMRVSDMLDADNQVLLRTHWQQRREGRSSAYELAWLKRDGSALHTLVSARPLFDAGGRFLGSLALISDITERKNLESQVLHSQKMEAIGQLAAGIAHEINTPAQYVADNTRFLRKALGAIVKCLAEHLALAQEAQRQGVLTELAANAARDAQEADLDYLLQEIPVALEQSLDGLARITKIVSSMKEFAHPGTDALTPMDINRAIENTIIVARNEWKYVAAMETHLDPEMPPVPCLPGELNQVILNLIVNAAHAIGEKMDGQGQAVGVIDVTTKAYPDRVEIRVGDTGKGIPAAVGQRVFDPFFTTKPPGKGTGQGLAIAHMVIAKKLHGSISFDSVEGKGTTFVIRLPLEQPAERS